MYHFRDILINLTTNYISNIIRVVSIQITITRKRHKTTNVRKNTRNAKRLKDFIHIAHLLEFLTTNTAAKFPNTWKTLSKNRLTHKHTSKNARGKERKENAAETFPRANLT